MKTVKSLHFCFLFIVTTVISNTFGAEFTYDDPNSWPSEFPTCDGNRQSPIALSVSEATTRTRTRLRFHHYSEILYSTVIRNNGHTASVRIGATNIGNRPAISGGGLTGRYIAENFHFHWGSPDNKNGSEHTINGVRYALEMHIVHRNENYSTLEEALGNPDGIAVLGVLYREVGFAPLNDFGLRRISKALPFITKSGSSYQLEQFTLQSLFDIFQPRNFFAYEGSLTTPPCTEGVTHMVIDSIHSVETDFLQNFYTLLDGRQSALLKTFRPLQNRNDRPIIYNMV